MLSLLVSCFSWKDLNIVLYQTKHWLTSVTIHCVTWIIRWRSLVKRIRNKLESDRRIVSWVSNLKSTKSKTLSRTTDAKSKTGPGDANTKHESQVRIEKLSKNCRVFSSSSLECWSWEQCKLYKIGVLTGFAPEETIFQLVRRQVCEFAARNFPRTHRSQEGAVPLAYSVPSFRGMRVGPVK